MNDLIELQSQQIKALQTELSRLNKENIKNLAKLQTAQAILEEIYIGLLNEIEVKE